MAELEIIQTNATGFDPKALGFDLENFSNVRPFNVVKILHEQIEGHLTLYRLELAPCELYDPTTDILLLGMIRRQNELVEVGGSGYHPRVIWGDKLWRVSNERDALTLLGKGAAIGDVFGAWVSCTQQTADAIQMMKMIYLKVGFAAWKGLDDK